MVHNEYSNASRVNHAAHGLGSTVNTVSSYLVLFEVGPLEVIAELRVKVVPETEDVCSVGPNEGVSASTGHTDDIHVSHSSFKVQLHLDRPVPDCSLSVTQPKAQHTANTLTFSEDITMFGVTEICILMVFVEIIAILLYKCTKTHSNSPKTQSWKSAAQRYK